MPSSLSANEAITAIVNGRGSPEHLKVITDDETLLLQLNNEQFQFSFGKPGPTTNGYQYDLFKRIQAIKSITPLTVAKWAVILNQTGYLKDTSPPNSRTPRTPIDPETANAVLPLATFYNKPRELAHGSLFRPDAQGNYPIITLAKYNEKEAGLEARSWKDEDVKDRDIGPLLHQAIQSKNKTLINALLTHDAIREFIVNVTSNPSKDSSVKESINTLLHEAVKTNDLTIVDLLLRTGIISNQPDEYNRYPLSYAAQHGHSEIFKRLAALSSNGIDRPDTQGRTPLSYAAESGCLTIG